MDKIRKHERLLLAVALLFIGGVAWLMTTSNTFAGRQKSSATFSTSLRKVINQGGWEIPGRSSFQTVSSTRQKEIDEVSTTIIVYTSRTETFVRLDGYSLSDNNVLIINSGQCLVKDLLAYQYEGRVFAWEARLVPVTDIEKEKGSATYPGATYNLFFVDHDGDGNFETRLGSLGLKEVPLWVKELKK